MQDVADGIDHLVGLDPGIGRLLDLRRLVLVGHSAGGQLALWAASGENSPTAWPPRPPRSVRPVAVIGLSPVTHLDVAGHAVVALLGGSRGDVPDRWDIADPVGLAPVPVPVLIVHPRTDQVVPIGTSRTYRDISRARGGEVRLVETADKQHSDPIDPASSS